MHNNGGSGHSTFPAVNLPPGKKFGSSKSCCVNLSTTSKSSEFETQGPKTQHIRIEPTGVCIPEKTETEKMSIQCGHRAKGYINGVYNYPLWMAENKWVTGVIYPNLLIGVGAHLVWFLIGHLPSGFYKQIAIMEHLPIMSSLV